MRSDRGRKSCSLFSLLFFFLPLATAAGSRKFSNFPPLNNSQPFLLLCGITFIDLVGEPCQNISRSIGSTTQRAIRRCVQRVTKKDILQIDDCRLNPILSLSRTYEMTHTHTSRLLPSCLVGLFLLCFLPKAEGEAQSLIMLELCFVVFLKCDSTGTGN